MLEEVGGGLRVVMEDATMAIVDKAEAIMDVVKDHAKLLKEDIKSVAIVPKPVVQQNPKLVAQQ